MINPLRKTTNILNRSGLKQISTSAMSYSVVEKAPSPEKFCELRKRAGLSPKSIEAATAALPNTVYGVSIINDEDNSIVGMGRLVGDKHLFLTVVDIAVFPEHQKKGLGRKIMESLMNYVKNNVTKDCYVSLGADGDAKFLYQKFGFQSTLPKTLGMAYKHPQ
jgi:ribosomal protein S18 acetylase RimI-like enzyme